MNEQNINIEKENSFDLAFARINYGDETSVTESLNEKKHRLESGTVSYRIINHWEQKGLLSSDRHEGKGWRKYSQIDIFWVHIIKRLREFGYPLKKINLIKERLSTGDQSMPQFPELEIYIAYAYARVPSFLAVFSNGKSMACTLPEFHASISLGLMPGNALLISINEILQKLNPNEDLHPDYSTITGLTKDEVSLLVAIRLNNWSELRIRGKQGKITMIERTENVDSEEKIVDILHSGSYQNIELKQQDGKVVSIKRTIKKKFE